MKNHKAIIPMEEYQELIKRSKQLEEFTSGKSLEDEDKEILIEAIHYCIQNQEELRSARTPYEFETKSFKIKFTAASPGRSSIIYKRKDL